MRLIIVRHGQTEENLEHIMIGHMPGKLTKEGIEQARKLALRLKDEKIDVIYSSDLKRAKDTTKEIIKYHSEINVNFTKKLRETDFGSITGIKLKDVDWKNLPKDVETLNQLYSRGKNFLDKIYSKHKKDTVLFVCHGAIKGAIIGVILDKGPDYIKESASIENASVSIFDINEDKKHIAHVINCVKHLRT
jgi:broad specificity phosphatase PhoE